ncbi:MAG TPA: hypothetical protein VKA70_11270 [Blastocatellia bacterium]|nr:hypothetical protein [Blastocatellia bacterium]
MRQTIKGFQLAAIAMLLTCVFSADISAQTNLSVPANNFGFNPPTVNSGVQAMPGQQFVVRVSGIVDLQTFGEGSLHIMNNAAGLLVADTTGWSLGTNGQFPLLLAGSPNPSPNQVAASGGCAPCGSDPVPLGSAAAGALLFGKFVPGQSTLSQAVQVVSTGSGSGPLVAIITTNFSGPIGFQVNEWYAYNNSGSFEVEISPFSLIDIKPEGVPNSINPRSNGVIPVAILTHAEFAASSVDPATVRFGATGTEAAAVHSALEDVDGDGDIDMILHFRTQQTHIACGATIAYLTGRTFGGQAIQGSDSVATPGCR